jgi:hypothetical protein
MSSDVMAKESSDRVELLQGKMAKHIQRTAEEN